MAETALKLLHQSFAMPGALALLLLLPALGVFTFLARRRRRRILARLGRIPALLALTEGGRQWLSMRRLCQSTALSFLIAGIAGPRWGLEPSPTSAPGRDLVVVLDLSRSMLADDGPPSRQARAREALDQLSLRLARRGGHRIALVAFASRAQVVCPLTHDYAHFREKLAELDAAHPPVALLPPPDAREFPSGTRIGAGLKEAVAQVLDARYTGQQDLLLVSDGDDPAGDQEWRQGLQAVRSAGVPVYTVGIGDPVKGAILPGPDGQPLTSDGQPVVSSLQREPLVAIAKGTGGEYLGAFTDVPRLDDFFRDRIEPKSERELTEDVLPRYHRRYAWFFGIALALLALDLAVGRRQKRPAPEKAANGVSSLGFRAPAGVRTSGFGVAFLAVVLISAAPASDSINLVRHGNAAFERGDYPAAVRFYEQAEPLITDPGLVAQNLAAALFRLERYRDAELHYRYCLSDATGPRRARALYDLATCLVQEEQGRNRQLLTEAIGLYQQCLREPEIEESLATDARHNLELAKLLRLQAPPPKKDREGDDPQKSEPKNSSDEPPPTAPEQPNPTAGQPELNKGQPQHTSPAPGDQPIPTDQRQAGRGNLPPVPDQDKLVPMSPEDAALHLQRATQRILREHRSYQLSSSAGAGRSVKPW
jgi:Ca-activated chloride channel family protein